MRRATRPKGRAAGGEAAVRMLLAAGIMLAPQLGTAAGILLLSPDHLGTNVPVLALWLVIDRAPRRWPAGASAPGCAGFFRGNDLVNQVLGAWLARHGLRYGMSTYWQANVVSLTTGERVMVVPVSPPPHSPAGPVQGDEWESDNSWYDPRLHDATFVVQLTTPTRLPAFLPMASVQNSFGRPAKTYLFGPYRVLVWHKNLLKQLG